MKRLYHADTYATVSAPSYWASTIAPEPVPPRLEGSAVTDVAIIGAGYTGLNAALQLVEGHGIRATVLDAAWPAWGASGRNGGFACIGGSKLSYTAMIRRHGLSETQSYFATQKTAIETVRSNLDRYGIDADTHSQGDISLAHRARDVAALRAEADFMSGTFGEKSRFIARGDLQAEGLGGPQFHAALHLPNGFALNPLKYALGLVRAARTAGVVMHANSPVTRISRENGRYHLHTPNGTLVASRLIIATNGYSSDDVPGWMNARTLPALSSILVTRPLTGSELAAQGWTSRQMSSDTRILLHYFRLLPDNRFLFGMRGGTHGSSVEAAGLRQTMQGNFARMFPAWQQVETPYYWSGLICLTRLLTNHVGPLGDWSGAWAGFGYHGGGVAMGSHTGRLLGDLAAGLKPDLPAPMRETPTQFPLPGLRLSYLRAAYRWYGLKDRG